MGPQASSDYEDVVGIDDDDGDSQKVGKDDDEDGVETAANVGQSKRPRREFIKFVRRGEEVQQVRGPWGCFEDVVGRSNVQGAGVDGVVVDLRVDEFVQFEEMVLVRFQFIWYVRMVLFEIMVRRESFVSFFSQLY